MGPDARQLIERARLAESPSPSQRARMRAQLQTALVGAAAIGVSSAAEAAGATRAGGGAAGSGSSVAGSCGGTVGSVGTSALSLGLLAPWIGGGCLAGVTLMAGIQLLSPLLPSSDAARSAQAPEPQRAVPAASQPLAGVRKSVVRDSLPAQASPSSVSSDLPRAIAAGLPPNVPPLRKPVGGPPTNHRLSSPQAVTPLAPPSAASASFAMESLRAEAALLERAHLAVEKNQLAEAQSLLSSHRQTFANGKLAEEREGIALLIQCRQHSAESSAAARLYLIQHPHSLLTPRIRQECSFSGTESAPSANQRDDTQTLGPR